MIWLGSGVEPVGAAADIPSGSGSGNATRPAPACKGAAGIIMAAGNRDSRAVRIRSRRIEGNRSVSALAGSARAPAHLDRGPQGGQESLVAVEVGEDHRF